MRVVDAGMRMSADPVEETLRKGKPFTGTLAFPLVTMLSADCTNPKSRRSFVCWTAALLAEPNHISLMILDASINCQTHEQTMVMLAGQRDAALMTPGLISCQAPASISTARGNGMLFSRQMY